MAIENVGPGGVSNSYGVRVTKTPVQMDTNIPKDVYTGFNSDQAALISKNAAGDATGITARKSGLDFPVSKPARIIACIGDSRTQLGDQFGTYFSILTNINNGTNTGAVPSVRAGLSCPAGTGTLRYNAAGKTMSWQWGTDLVPGPPVAVKDGVFTLTTPTATANIEIRVIARILPTVDKQDTITASATRSWRRVVGSSIYATDALTRGRFIFRNYGISGSGSQDVRNHYADALESGADIIRDETGTNDIVALQMAPAASVALRAANWDLALSRGIPVLAHLIAPRGGVGTGTTEAPLSAAIAANIVAANKGYIAEARKRLGVYIVDIFSKSVKQDVTITQIKDLYTTDGVHDSGGLAYEVAEAEAKILNTLVPDDSLTQNIGAGSYFNSTNPGGNLMPAGQGWFAGTGGTPGTGVTAGTGLATGFTASRTIGAAATAVANKALATDGGADWQEFAVAGATQVAAQGVKDETFLVASGFLNMANFQVGDTVTGSVEYEITGSGCTGIQMSAILSVTPAIQWEAFQLGEVVQGIRQAGTISLEPIQWQTGTSAALVRIFFASKAGASFSVRFRNLDLHKVVSA